MNATTNFLAILSILLIGAGGALWTKAMLSAFRLRDLVFCIKNQALVWESPQTPEGLAALLKGEAERSKLRREISAETVRVTGRISLAFLFSIASAVSALLALYFSK